MTLGIVLTLALAAIVIVILFTPSLTVKRLRRHPTTKQLTDSPPPYSDAPPPKQQSPQAPNDEVFLLKSDLKDRDIAFLWTKAGGGVNILLFDPSVSTDEVFNLASKYETINLQKVTHV